MRRPSLITILPVLALAVIPARAQENTKIAKIEELLKLSKAEARMQQTYSQMRAMMSKQVEAAGVSEEARATVAQMLDKNSAQIQELLSWEKMKHEFVRLYDEVYSEEEINGILAFYKSPAGQAFLNKTPLLMTKTMEMVQRRMADVMPEIQRVTLETLEKAKEKKQD